MKQQQQKKKTKSKPFIISYEAYEFLLHITQPADLNHTASHAEFIRNNTLKEIRKKINYAYNKERI